MGPGDFEQLLLVQERDSAIDQLRHQRATLPERAALEAVDSQASDLSVRRTVLEGRRQELTTAQERLEADVAAVSRRIAEVEARLYGGTVSASRELMAMTEEVDSLKHRRSDLEDRALEIMEAVEPVDQELSALAGEEESLEEQAAVLRTALGQAEAGIDGELERLARARSEVAATLPGDLEARYEQLRHRLGGIGAARLVNGSCSGCHLSLPASELDRIRHAPPDVVLLCDQCGRILVR